MNSNLRQAIIGIIVMLSTIWIGAWILHQADGTWMEFPIWATAFVIFIAAFVTTCNGLDKMTKEKVK